MTDINDFLTESGGKSAKFPTIGTTVSGTIVEIMAPNQQTDMQGNAIFYKDGNPAMQMRVRAQTDERIDEDDDGVRTFYVKGQMRKALIDAIKASGKPFAEGGKLTVTYIADGTKGASGFAPKHYAVKYEPGVAPGADAFLSEGLVDSAPTTQAPPSNIDPAQWAALPDDVKAKILASTNGAPF